MAEKVRLKQEETIASGLVLDRVADELNGLGFGSVLSRVEEESMLTPLMLDISGLLDSDSYERAYELVKHLPQGSEVRISLLTQIGQWGVLLGLCEEGDSLYELGEKCLDMRDEETKLMEEKGKERKEKWRSDRSALARTALALSEFWKVRIGEIGDDLGGDFEVTIRPILLLIMGEAAGEVLNEAWINLPEVNVNQAKMKLEMNCLLLALGAKDVESEAWRLIAHVAGSLENDKARFETIARMVEIMVKLEHPDSKKALNWIAQELKQQKDLLDEGSEEWRGLINSGCDLAKVAIEFHEFEGARLMLGEIEGTIIADRLWGEMARELVHSGYSVDEVYEAVGMIKDSRVRKMARIMILGPVWSLEERMEWARKEHDSLEKVKEYIKTKSKQGVKLALAEVVSAETSEGKMKLFRVLTEELGLNSTRRWLQEHSESQELMDRAVMMVLEAVKDRVDEDVFASGMKLLGDRFWQAAGWSRLYFKDKDGESVGRGDGWRELVARVMESQTKMGRTDEVDELELTLSLVERLGLGQFEALDLTRSVIELISCFCPREEIVPESKDDERQMWLVLSVAMASLIRQALTARVEDVRMLAEEQLRQLPYLRMINIMRLGEVARGFLEEKNYEKYMMIVRGLSSESIVEWIASSFRKDEKEILSRLGAI